ncbi:capsule biosynthesis protein, partial [Bacteroides caecimuris]
FIPKSTNTVKINGAVMVPNTVSYIAGKNIDYYLNQAGGYSDNARKSKKFIIYMNGQVAKVKGSGKKQIEAGCEIIVPNKERKKNNLGNILGYATSFSSLGMMIASLANLIKK